MNDNFNEEKIDKIIKFVYSELRNKEVSSLSKSKVIDNIVKEIEEIVKHED